MSARRYGMTVPFDGVPLHDHRRWFEELVALGYTDAWSAEVDGADGFTPLALAAAWAPSLRLGIAIAPAFTRGPALLAQTVAAMADAAPGRFTLGLGASSDVIVERWNGIPYVQPYRKVRDTLRFLRTALAGEKVNGFRLARPVEQPPPIHLAALRSGMLQLAGREADGAILNWLSAEDVPTAVAEVAKGAAAVGAEPSEREIVARIFVVPEPDPEVARAIGRRMVAAYLNVPAYADFHRWLGRGPQLQGMWDAWAAGDRKAALAAIPDQVVDDLVVHGSTEVCRAHVERYVANGITVPALMVVPGRVDLAEAVRGLAPAAGG